MIMLDKILEKCLDGQKKFGEAGYKVPGLWFGESGEISFRNPYEFFAAAIQRVMDLGGSPGSHLPGGGMIYNLFIRLAAAWDHDGDSELGIPYGRHGFRETGSFLKAIALLPYIKSLGADTVYLLPVNKPGLDRKKGRIGSPYAVFDHMDQDDFLSEPLDGFSASDQYFAFIEAAHLAGLRVVQEFVFRTASVDSRLAIEHPDWFYWIRESLPDRHSRDKAGKGYGPPVFQPREIETIRRKVREGHFARLPSPHDEYKKMFTDVPESVAREDGRITGWLKNGTRVRIPGAFADWPPDDNQPVWSDVTYLRLYHHPGYNYIAYNTIRMYDEELAAEENENKPLWEYIVNIIPHYIKKYQIDGVMIDMGHALPAKLRAAIVDSARDIKPGFIFWEENFNLTAEARRAGYDAALGYMPFDEHRPGKLREIIKMFETGRCPIPFFATAETHNTPRAATRHGGEKYSKMALAVNYLLPIPVFLHNGCELGETMPVNTGLDFSESMIAEYPPELLPLFSEGALPWDNQEFMPFMRALRRLRYKILPASPVLLHANNEHCVAFLVRNDEQMKEYIFAGNFSDRGMDAEIDAGAGAERIMGIFETALINPTDGKFKLHLPPWQYFVGEVVLSGTIL